MAATSSIAVSAATTPADLERLRLESVSAASADLDFDYAPDHALVVTQEPPRALPQFAAPTDGVSQPLAAVAASSVAVVPTVPAPQVVPQQQRPPTQAQIDHIDEMNRRMSVALHAGARTRALNSANLAQLRTTHNAPSNAPDMPMPLLKVPTIAALESRIAELEAQVAELKGRALPAELAAETRDHLMKRASDIVVARSVKK